MKRLLTLPARLICLPIARRMNAANGSYPYPRLAAWVRRQAGVDLFAEKRREHLRNLTKRSQQVKGGYR